MRPYLLLLVAAGLLASPALAEHDALRKKHGALRKKAAARKDRAAKIRALTNRAARRTTSMSMPEGVVVVDEPEAIVPSDPTEESLLAAIAVMAEDMEDPEKTLEDTAADALSAAMGVPPEIIFGPIGGPISWCGGAPSFSIACECVADLSGGSPGGVRDSICAVLGPIFDLLEEALDTDIPTAIIGVIANILDIIGLFLFGFDGGCDGPC